MRGLFDRLKRSRSGATSIEYGLIAAGIALAIISAVTLFASNGTGVFNTAMEAIATAVSGSGGGSDEDS